MDQAARDTLLTLEQSGELKWEDSKGKKDSLALEEKPRHLLRLLAAAVEKRMATGDVGVTRGHLDDQLFQKLEDAWPLIQDSTSREENISETSAADAADVSVWHLKSVETIGFGGLNGASCIQPLVVEFSNTATCIRGGNGSGKTSLISAICWALTGQRLSDIGGPNTNANIPQPIFDSTEPSKELRTWPPIATYPRSAVPQAHEPKTKVTLTFFKRGSGDLARIVRRWDAAAPGNTIEEWDEVLQPLKAYLDVAVEMPLRIAHLRLGQNDRLNDAVASLTGLDLVTGIGELAAWLARKNAPFSGIPKKAEHDASRMAIGEKFGQVAQLLPELDANLAPLKALEDWLDRIDEYGEGLKKIADDLTKTAADDMQSLKEFISPTIDLETAEGQRDATNAIAAATNAYTSAFLKDQFTKKCPLLVKISDSVKNSKDITEKLQAAIACGKSRLTEILSIHQRRREDPKLALKAVAAETHHAMHGEQPINNCVLCERAFDTETLKTLGAEIQHLRQEAELLRANLRTSCVGITNFLNDEVKGLTSFSLADVVSLQPIDALRDELRDFLVSGHTFSEQLSIFGRLFDSKFSTAIDAAIPKFAVEKTSWDFDISRLSSEDRAIVQSVIDSLDRTARAIEIVHWGEAGLALMRTFYSSLLGDASEEASTGVDTLRGVCKSLSRAVADAKPSLTAAANIRGISADARTWIMAESKRRLRAEIASGLEPLTKLPKYVDGEIGRQIERLSTGISKIVERFHLAAMLEFQRARFERPPRQRVGLVRARAAPKRFAESRASNDNKVNYEVDAALIANTSWMRALLWAFVFALRQERAGAAGSLPLPLVLMDDPQVTFDSDHRCAWIDFMMSADAEIRIFPEAQAILTSHDDAFVRQIQLQTNRCDIRNITAPSGEFESVFVFGTTGVDRFWEAAESTKENEDASRAVGELRIYLENLTKAIFPRALGSTATTLGQLMDELQGKVNAGAFPYGGDEFRSLLRAWKEPAKEKCRLALSEVHHNNDAPYDYFFAKEVFAWFNKGLHAPFQKAFECIRQLREAGWRTPHSGVSVISSVSGDAPVGKPSILPANVNQLIGRVAAESDGRGVEGSPKIRFVKDSRDLPELGELEVLVVAAATLEPAAEIGDVLLLSPTLAPTENSLIVCHADGAMRARRFGSLGVSAEHAVLVANSINPREIRHPILVQRTPEKFRKVVGIIYRGNWSVPNVGEDETAELEEVAAFDALVSKSIGRIQVVGDSAEPVALQGQYLLSGPEILNLQDLREYDGRPIVASVGEREVFKRLRWMKSDSPIVLESLNASERHPPIIITPDEASALGDQLKFWPVIGILFDTGPLAR